MSPHMLLLVEIRDAVREQTSAIHALAAALLPAVTPSGDPDSAKRALLHGVARAFLTKNFTTSELIDHAERTDADLAKALRDMVGPIKPSSAQQVGLLLRSLVGAPVGPDLALKNVGRHAGVSLWRVDLLKSPQSPQDADPG